MLFAKIDLPRAHELYTVSNLVSHLKVLPFYYLSVLFSVKMKPEISKCQIRLSFSHIYERLKNGNSYNKSCLEDIRVVFFVIVTAGESERGRL